MLREIRTGISDFDKLVVFRATHEQYGQIVTEQNFLHRCRCRRQEGELGPYSVADCLPLAQRPIQVLATCSNLRSFSVSGERVGAN
jgi:hypothetical protein